jgi:hypothetical protein
VFNFLLFDVFLFFFFSCIQKAKLEILKCFFFFFLNYSIPGGRRMSERDMTRIGAESKPSTAGPQLLNSKSVPALHHIGELTV